MEFGLGSSALPFFPYLVRQARSLDTAMADAGAGAEAAPHWELQQVAWNPSAMVAWPAGEAPAPVPNADSQATAAAAAPPRPPGANCCQIPGCQETPDGMRDYNQRCRCGACRDCPTRVETART